MNSPCIVKVIGAASGAIRTPHDGRYVVAWDPHTKFGTLSLTSTNDITQAHHFPSVGAAMAEWSTISSIQLRRPDGLPNKPLTGLTIATERVDAAA